MRIRTAMGAWLRPLLELPLFGLLLVMTIGLFVVAQRPLNYDVAIGQEDRWGADLPFVYDWNTDESSEAVRYRWTGEDSRIVLSGLPRHPFVAELSFLPADANPRVAGGIVTLYVSPQTSVDVPLSLGSRTVHMFVADAAVVDGRLDLAIRAPTWTPDNDPRTLGVPVDHFSLVSVADAQSRTLIGQAPVSWAFFWPLLLLVVTWVPLRRWGASRTQATVLGLILVLLLLLANAEDRPRFALAARPVVIGLAWASVWALGLRWGLGGLTRKLAIPASVKLLDLLVLLFFASFALRYIGRLYPLSMPGDLGFHINREHDVLRGLIMLVSRHRGIDFPYPPALYLLLLPLRLLPISADQLVEFTDALFGALGIFPIAYLALAGTGEERTARFAAIVYALLAPAMMSLWWSFQPHIFAQELAIWLFAGIVWGWTALGTRRGVLFATVELALLFASHFGFYINISVLLGVVLVVVLIARRRPWVVQARSSFVGLFSAFIYAQIIVLVLFYSSYASLIINKLLAFEEGGMGAVQGGRQAATQAELWRTLWQAGFQIHYATIGVPLAVLGGYYLWSQRHRSIVPLLFGATLAVAVVQAAIPFLTSSTITTRWLSFAAWIIAIGISLVLGILWRYGRAGRLLSIAIVAWIGWTTIFMWVQAMGYRIRPPEPF